jgi:hypothetical protein
MPMSSTSLSIVNNIFTVFAPGSGGNHISNLVSTDPRLISRFELNDYKDKTNKAHYFDNKVLDKDNIDLKKILNEKRSYGTHFFEFGGFGFAKLIKKSFIVISMPDEDSKGHTRMKELYPAFQDNYFWYECKSLYTASNFIKIFDIQEPCVEINGNDLFEGRNFIKDLLDKTKTLGLDLDADICKSAHDLWLSKI